MFGLFQKKDEVSLKVLVANGAIVVDVRGEVEFACGHSKDAVNVPLDRITSLITEYGDVSTCFIVCCQSGGRSSVAKSILKKAGYENVYDGGGWQDLERKIG